MALDKLIRCGPSNIGARNEKDIYDLIEQDPKTLEALLNAKYKKVFPRLSNIKDRPDYLFTEAKTEIEIYVEVKPWEVTIRDMQQLFKYYIHLKERGKRFKLYVICATINPYREDILKTLEIGIIFLKDFLNIPSSTSNY